MGDGGEGDWQRVNLAAGGTFTLDLDGSDHEFVEVMTHFEGSADFARACSDVLKLERLEPAG